jgi:hypothetical protein
MSQNIVNFRLPLRRNTGVCPVLLTELEGDTLLLLQMILVMLFTANLSVLSDITKIPLLNLHARNYGGKKIEIYPSFRK